MLIEFSVKNYRSFRDEAVLSMEATKSSTLKSVLIPFGGMQILPSAVISEHFGLLFNSSEMRRERSTKKQPYLLYHLH